jgi:hypothetical protein
MLSSPGTSRAPSFRHLLFGRRLMGAWMLLGFGLCSLPVFLGALNHDEAWYLVVAGRVLAGERLYVEVLDTNPPLIVWLNLLPVLIARSVGVSEILVLRLLVLALVAVSLGLSGWILRQTLPDRPMARQGLLFLSLFVLLPVVGYEFAQREHLMMILALPYLWMASSRASGSRFDGGVAWVVGLMAGVGLAIKPHFTLLWLAVEATLVVRRGWRIAFRPEGLMIAAIGLAYGAAVLAITPDYLPWIRRITSVYYGAGSASFASLASEPGTILTTLALLGFLVLRPEGEGRKGLEVILAADLALLAIALLQVKGFAYQFYPAMAVAILLIGRLLVEFSPAPADRARIVLMVRVVLLLLMLSVVANRIRDSISWRGRPDESDTVLGQMIRVAKEHAGGGSVFVFSPAVPAAFPMVNYAGVGWASRHPALLFLPGCYPGGSGTDQTVVLHPPDKMSDSERFLFDGVIDKLLTDQPTLLFVDETGTPLAFEGRRFDYLGYYAQDPRFAAFLREYEPFTRVDRFRVYRRKTRSMPAR